MGFLCQIGAKDIADFVPHCPKTKMNYALKIVVSSGKGEAKDECNIPLVPRYMVASSWTCQLSGSSAGDGKADVEARQCSR